MLYLWLKALHIIAVISWMAGLLYLPRLFVYHATAPKGGELSETLKIMERRLLNAITTPAMIASLVFGGWMLIENPSLLTQSFMQAKLAFVALLLAVHVRLAVHAKAFAADRNRHSSRYFRVLNEAPTLLMIAIVLLVILRPLFV